MANTTVPVPMATTPWGNSQISLTPAATETTYYPGAMIAVYAKYGNAVAYSGVTHSILVGWVDKVLDSTHVLVTPIYGPLTPLAVASNTLTFAGATGANTIVMPDNLADALSVVQGANAYLT